MIWRNSDAPGFDWIPLDVHVVESCNLERIGQRLSPAQIKMSHSYYITCRNCELWIQLTTIPEEEELLWLEVFDKVAIYEEEAGFYI
jgi:hypothetical protein